MKQKLLLTFLIINNILWANTEIAAPANDNFANAIPITCGNNYTASTLEATIDEDNAPDSTNPVVDLDAPNIWYTYTGSGIAETVTLDLCASGYDTSYLVYTGTSGNLTLVASNDDNADQCGSGFRSYGTFESDGTTTYYITVTGYGPTNIGDVNMTVSCEEILPTPDTIELAIPIVPSPEGTGCASFTFNLDFTTTGTTDSGLGGCEFSNSEGLDQFFTWTATSNGLKYNTASFSGRASITIRNNEGEIIDCTAAAENNSAILTGWQVGDNLTIQIYKSQGQSGTADAIFCLEEKTIVSPPNDTAAGAIPITPGLAGSDCTITNNNQTIFFNTDTYTTTDSGFDSTCITEGTGVDQFFTWTATSTGLLWGQNPNNVGIAVRSTSGVEYGCIVRNQGDPIKLSGWQLGEELIIQIFNYKNYHYDSLAFCLREYNTSVNDLITGAIPIVPDGLGDDCSERTLLFGSDGTTDSGLDGTCNTANTGYDQFFTWTATTNALSWSGLTENPGIIIRDTAGNEITCADTIAPDNTILSGWEIGDELIIQIYDWVFIINSGTASGNVEDSYRDVSFCLKEEVLAPPPGTTFVPDDNFEQNLIDRGLDDVLDNYVITANINTITAVDISNSNVADLTGIEDFIALQFLYAYGNQLTSIDITQNTALEVLEVNGNNINAIDLTQNTALVDLQIWSNPITTINLTQNVALEKANFQHCQLTAIDVSQNIALKDLSVIFNSQISTINVSTNTNLEGLGLTSTQVSTVDLTNNLNLKSLFLGNCPIANLDVSTNLALEFLNISGTLIQDVNLSNHPVFDALFAENTTALTNINVQNGNNTNFRFFYTRSTPNLECVQVDDVAYSTTNWTFVDSGINFSTLCAGVNDECVDAINIPISSVSCDNVVTATMQDATDSNSLHCFGDDANFSDIWFSFTATETSHIIKLQNLTGSPDFLWHTVIDAQTYTCGNITNAIYCTDALEDTATGLTVGNTYYVQVYSHEANANTVFDICVSPVVPANQVYVPDDNFEQALIDLGYDTVLDNLVLRANVNTVTTLDVVNKNIADLTGIEAFVVLEELYVDRNNITTTINLTQNPLLKTFFAESNTITTLDLTQNPLLETVYVGGNSLAALDVTQNPQLELLFVENNSLSSIDVTQNPVLGHLGIGGNNISALNITQNIFLTYVSAINNSLTTIDLSQNFSLKHAYLSNNQLSAIDVTLCPVLEDLGVFSNPQIQSVDVSLNPNLETLNVSFTQVSAIDVSSNLNLERLSFVNCPVTEIDVTANLALTHLSVAQSLVTSVDVSGNPVFESISCRNSPLLANLNMQNGNNTNVSLFLATDTPNLSCIQVDDVAYSTTNWTSVDSGVNFSTSCPTLVYVPDDNFEQALIDLGYDNVLDDYVLASNINTITSLSINDKNIADLTGIQGFTALQFLYVFNNPLGSLNLTQNPALELLNANNASLTTIDLTQNSALQFLSIESNSLTTIDITQNPALISASLQSNQLTGIDVSQNGTLETLNLVQNTQLANLDVSANSSLTTLNLNFTQISNLDVTNNPNLETISAASCPITTLNVSNNLNLKILSLVGTPITKVDVSNNPIFESLYVSNCSDLTGINIQNGNNTNVEFFFAISTPNLTCVQVDDIAYSTANWTNVDSGTNFSIDCGFLENDECVDAIDIPISNVLCDTTVAGTLAQASDSNVFQCFGNTDFSDVWYSFVATETTHNVKILNTSGANSRVFHAVIDAQTYTCGNITDAIYCTDSTEGQATDLTIGNKYFVQVYTDVANSTETFDVCVSTTSSPGLTYVPDDNFEQALIDLGYDTTLDDYVTTANINTVNDLNVRNLSIFDLTGIEDFAALEILNCGLNFLGELDLSNNSNLNYLIADNAALVGLNMKNGNNTNVTTFITLGNVDLFCVQVDDAAYSTANWTIIEQTTNFSEFCGDPIQVAAKVYLQGAMLQHTDGSMRTDLKDNDYISTVSPYTDGTAIVATDPIFIATGQDKIVDWIWIELRDATNPSVIIDGKSALLQRDGDIVEALADDTSTPVSFNQEAGDYYVVIKHRNHLGIMSNSALALSTTVTTVDFTDSNNQITYGTNAQTTFGMPANSVAMWCGNVNGDNLVQYSGTNPDVPTILSTVLNDAGNFLNFPTYVVSGYDANDVNMDGNVQYTGTNPDTPFILQNIFAHPGNFLNFSTYQITEQLPQSE